MEARDVLIQLFQHAAWANDAVLASLRSTPGRDAAALEQIAHTLGAEHVWLSRIRGDVPRFAVWPTLSLAECEALAVENREGFFALLSSGVGDSLDQEVTYVNSAGRTFTNRVIDILIHVAMHGSYHRGMTSIITRRSEGTPAPTDFIAFIRGAPTATRQDVRS
jgi:uncharacterized damage-inducible protein DinB